MYAIIEGDIVVNIVVWDGNANEWQPPEGSIAIEVTDGTGVAYLGGSYVDGKFIQPPVLATGD